MYLFYATDIPSTVAVGQPVVLDEEESAHAVRVLRYSAGDTVYIADGRGTMYEAVISNPHPKHCEVEITAIKPQHKHHNGTIHIAVAPTKNIERTEWLTEKCTEIGVDTLTPLLCHYSERKVIRTDRLQKIVLSAAKQSLKRVLPQVDELTGFADVIAQTAGNPNCQELKYIAFCDPDHIKSQISSIIPENTPLPADVTIMIGPEGDFSPKEIQTAIQAGYTPLSLGPARLRTETAALVSVAALYIRFASFSQQK